MKLKCIYFLIHVLLYIFVWSKRLRKMHHIMEVKWVANSLSGWINKSVWWMIELMNQWTDTSMISCHIILSKLLCAALFVGLNRKRTHSDLLFIYSIVSLSLYLTLSQTPALAFPPRPLLTRRQSLGRWTKTAGTRTVWVTRHLLCSSVKANGRLSLQSWAEQPNACLVDNSHRPGDSAVSTHRVETHIYK